MFIASTLSISGGRVCSRSAVDRVQADPARDADPDLAALLAVTAVLGDTEGMSRLRPGGAVERHKVRACGATHRYAVRYFRPGLEHGIVATIDQAGGTEVIGNDEKSFAPVGRRSAVGR